MYPPSTVAYDPTTYTATFTFAARVPFGSAYTASLAAGSVADPTGKALASPYSFRFYDILGDTDGDGRVNVADLGNLATNFGVSTGATWINGDFDYNGNVNVADLGDLASNFGVDLTGVGGSVTATVASTAAPAIVPLVCVTPEGVTWQHHRSVWSELPLA
jgi:hypothetical protein